MKFGSRGSMDPSLRFGVAELGGDRRLRIDRLMAAVASLRDRGPAGTKRPAG
ncbi:MAG: hypothetical protein AAGF23_07090 [Acidobacteriota bacterium]